ncbi:hypothetical protein [uncultured Nostoc sp.]|uniref:hypothetical protein n=1 Tax=uncultured Nostoc sp. TaxID=340711 RepID=UPI0035C96B6F
MLKFLIRINRETGKRGAQKDWALDASCQIEAQRNWSIDCKPCNLTAYSQSRARVVSVEARCWSLRCGDDKFAQLVTDAPHWTEWMA